MIIEFQIKVLWIYNTDIEHLFGPYPYILFIKCCLNRAQELINYELILF